MKRIVILLIISAAFLSACTSNKLVRTTVVKEYDFTVTLEQPGENGEIALQKYEHPYEIDLADLEKLMGGLTYIEKDGPVNKNTQSPVFQAVEIDRLAPVLADALAKADTRQRVRFISFNKAKAMMFSVPRKTEGVVFVESDGRINIAFNYINSNRSSSETSAFYLSYSKVNPLKIKTSASSISSTAPYAELHKFETGKQAPMWIVADLEKLRESNSNAAVTVGTRMEKDSQAAVTRTVAMSAPANETAASQASENLLKEDIKNKLTFLKELIGEGLISEKDYNAKKNELLDKIN